MFARRAVGALPLYQDAFEWEKHLGCPLVSQICTLWPLRFHQEFFSLMQPICPDGYPPTAISYPPTAVDSPQPPSVPRHVF